jgi:ubiquinone/menaquinone biosynthesis C-methylase UbiE
MAFAMQRPARTLRRKIAGLVSQRPWLPPAATGIAVVGTMCAIVLRAPIAFGLIGAAFTAGTAFAWGYTTRMRRDHHFPPLVNLPRREYAEVWDSLATSQRAAFAAVAGQRDDDGLQISARTALQNIFDLAGVGKNDDVLEIGCGVGRIGHELAPHCRTWTGADISANLLQYAAQRLRDLANVSLVRLHNVGLSGIADSSVDLVYATNMVMHLDEMDRWKYAQEAFRVLRPGGRIFIDSIDLESDAGWTMFANDAKRFEDVMRPPYLPRFSTASELMVYAKRSGFEHVQAQHRAPLVIMTAVKPGRSAAPGGIASQGPK